MKSINNLFIPVLLIVGILLFVGFFDISNQKVYAVGFGHTCNTEAGVWGCDTGTQCTVERCLWQNGHSCVYGSECDSGICQNSVCRAPASGGRCSRGSWNYCLHSTWNSVTKTWSRYNGCSLCVDGQNWGVCSTQDYPAHCSYEPFIDPTSSPTSTAVPTARPTGTLTRTPTPTPTLSPAPTIVIPTISSSCACGGSVCDVSCPVYGLNGSGPGPSTRPFKCSLLESILSTVPDSFNQHSWCRRLLRNIGDANGDNEVNNTDYLYYVQAVNGGKIPPLVNPDISGDGEVGLTDRQIITDQISQNPPNCCNTSQSIGGYQCIQDCGSPVAQPGDPTPGFSCLNPTQAASRLQTGCPVCLSSSTLISTPEGAVRVSDIGRGMMVWSTDKNGNKISVSVHAVSSVYVGTSHRMFHLVMSDGRSLFVSPGHPLSTGAGVENLKIGDPYNGSTVKSIDLVPYGDTKTYDLLPDSETGAYFANGILMGSTMMK